MKYGHTSFIQCCSSIYTNDSDTKESKNHNQTTYTVRRWYWNRNSNYRISVCTTSLNIHYHFFFFNLNNNIKQTFINTITYNKPNEQSDIRACEATEQHVYRRTRASIEDKECAGQVERTKGLCDRIQARSSKIRITRGDCKDCKKFCIPIRFLESYSTSINKQQERASIKQVIRQLLFSSPLFSLLYFSFLFSTIGVYI